MKRATLKKYLVRTWRLCGFGVVTLCLGVAPIWVRATIESRHYLEAAQSAPDFLARANLYTQALSWHIPGNRYAGEAAQKLLNEIRSQQLSGPEKFEALSLLRSGLFMTRSIFPSHFDTLRSTIEQELTAYAPRDAVVEVPSPHLNQGYALLSQLGFWGWICAVIATIFSAMDPTGQWSRPRLARGALTSILFFLLWLTALRNA